MLESSAFSGWESPAAKKGDPAFTFNAPKTPERGTPAPSLGSPADRRSGANVEFGTPKSARKFASPQRSTKKFQLSPERVQEVIGMVTKKLESDEFNEVNMNPERVEIRYEMPMAGLRVRLPRLERKRPAKKPRAEELDVPELKEGQKLEVGDGIEICPDVTRSFRVAKGSVEVACGESVWKAGEGAEFSLSRGKKYEVTSGDGAVLVELA